MTFLASIRSWSQVCEIILTSFKVVPPSFELWSCIASTFDKGWRGDHKHKIMDRPFMPKYGTVSQELLQLDVALSLAIHQLVIVCFGG